jgi:hypothetical protein
MIALGQALGFSPTREVAGTVLSLRLDDAYLPRADVLWSLELTAEQAGALSKVTGAGSVPLRQLPVVGIEIEGTTPTTVGERHEPRKTEQPGTRARRAAGSDPKRSGLRSRLLLAS